MKNNLIPNFYYDNIFEIDYNHLKNNNIKGLLFDLDNTLTNPRTKLIDDKTIIFLKKLEKEFKVLIVSNNSNKRIGFALKNNFNYVYRAFKPFKKGFKKALKQINLNKENLVMIGDQLLTDVKGANSFGIKSLLVSPLSYQDEKLVSKINRFREKRKLKKLLKKYPDIFKEKLLLFYNNKNK